MESSLQLRERLGERIRELRHERRMSLRDVASSVGCSASALSYIENGKNHPSVDLLARIVQQFDVSLEAVLGGALPRIPRPSEAGVPVEFTQFLLPPGARRAQADTSAPGTIEVVFVVEGQLTLRVGPAVYTLSAGSSAQFEDDGLVYVNQGAMPAVVLSGRVARSPRGRTRAAS